MPSTPTPNNCDRIETVERVLCNFQLTGRYRASEAKNAGPLNELP